MKKFIFILFAFAWIIIQYGCNKPDKKVDSTNSSDNKSKDKSELIKKGKHLVDVLDCTTCHSPKVMTPKGPVPDTTRFLSGHPADDTLKVKDYSMIKEGWSYMSPGVTAFVGPWGTSFAGNLTPDATGIGTWTLVQFKKALREGKYKGLDGSRPLMPPMPWEAYAKLTDEDFEAIFEYLKSIKPIKNIVPAYVPPIN